MLIYHRWHRFYFAYCEAAFDAKYIHDFQLTWLKTAPSSEQALATRSDSVSITDSDKRHILLRTDDPADPFTQASLRFHRLLNVGRTLRSPRKLVLETVTLLLRTLASASPYFHSKLIFGARLNLNHTNYSDVDFRMEQELELRRRM